MIVCWTLSDAERTAADLSQQICQLAKKENREEAQGRICELHHKETYATVHMDRVSAQKSFSTFLVQTIDF